MEKDRGQTNRIWQLDALRGLALLNMLAYHAMYDWVYIFGQPSGWYSIWSLGCHIWQQYICQSFILLSGFSFWRARRPLKNGLVVAGCALLLSVVTIVFMPSEAIWFGVLHLNACAVLLSALLKPLLEKLPAALGLAGCAALFLLTNQIPAGYLGFERWRLAALPASLYRGNLFVLGLPDLSKFASADYFPLVPWLFLFWCGLFLGRLLEGRLRAAPAPAALRPLCLLGAHTLPVYMAHQPILYGVLWLVTALMGR